MTGDEAIGELLELDYRFFTLASRVPGLHPCAAEQLHADYALANSYADLIACVRSSTLDDARRVIAERCASYAAAEALAHAKATVLTIISIHGRRSPCPTGEDIAPAASRGTGRRTPASETNGFAGAAERFGPEGPEGVRAAR